MDLETVALALGAVSAVYTLTLFKSAISDVIESREHFLSGNPNAEGDIEVCMTMREYRRLQDLAEDHNDKDISRMLRRIRKHGRRASMS